MKRPILKYPLFIFAVAVLAFSLSACKKTPPANTNIIVTDLVEKDVNDYIDIKKSYEGKLLVVNFFASWCPPCRAETPGFVRVYEKYKDKNFAIVAYTIDDDKQAAIDFVNRYGMTFPVYVASKAMQSKYGVAKVPTTFIYGTDGALLEIVPGMIAEESLEEVAKFALEK